MLDLDLGPMTLDLGQPSAVSVTRPGVVTGTDGLGNPISTPEALTRSCIWHPTSRNVLLREGLDMTKAWMTIYATEEIREADIFPLEGEDWTLFDLLPYSGSGLWTGRALREE